MKTFKKIPATNHSISIRKKIYGIGVNDSDYLTVTHINGKIQKCQFYRAWHSMMKRCYSDQFHKIQPNYINCEVAKEWMSFMSFRRWMKNQDWEGNHLDKDLLYPGNKIYSREKCIFVSHSINNLIKIPNKKSKLPVGVNMLGKTYVAEVVINRKRVRLGTYKTKEEAALAYNKAKSKHVTEIAMQQTNIRLKTGLLNHASIISNRSI